MKKPNLNLKRASLLTSSLLCSALLIAVPLRKELNEGWKFKQARLSNWYPATVPGVVHTDLMDNKIIEDPFFRLNERGMQWIDKEDWIYQTTFQLTPEMMGRENIDLIFKGLDTYADVYLNEKKILEANNMFREWKTSIKPDLKPGENVLKIYFHSPIKVDIPKWDALPYQYEAGNDQSENGGVFNKKVSVFARKAGYHYGWDWGPRLVTSGIWRPVYVEAWDNARINDVFIRQPEVSKSRASLIGEVEILADKEIDQANVTITEAASGRVLAGQTVSLQKGINKISLPFSIKSPKLWWSNGLGEPHLYSFRTDLTVNNQTSDAWTEEVGLRSLKIINRPDKDGKTFYVELNGIPVFAKGANYIPQDNFLPRVTPGQYEKTILDAANANMNMLRIWGGGTYESDLFYQLCDRYGILVWQDFMFACSLYPAEGELLENIRQEAIDNVKRLRNHACIALWCGNNECNDAWFNWGWQKRYKAQNPEYEQKIWKQFNDQYNVTLPQVVEEYAPESFYWPSSPFARYDGGSDDRNGDRHYWEVWHGKKPIEMYNKERSRFFSEYGFQSFPEFESVKRYAPRQEDWDIYSEIMMSHQRGGMHANELIETYLLNEYRKPRNFEAFLYMNHVLQGDAIKTAIEAHRRDMPYCMGTLFWQHNDCWPVASWASRDYYGRWKAQHYFARKAYRDILVSPIADEDGQLKVQIVSDRHKACNGRLEVKVMKLTGEVLNSYKRNVIVDANSSKALFSVPLDEALKGVRKEDVFIHAVLLTDKGNSNYTNNYFLVKQKEVNYPKAQLATSVQPIEGGFEVTLSSDNFARAVFIATGDANSSFSDNYFDILPGSSVKVEVYTDLPLATFEKQLKVVSLSDEY
ncbi:glycoside hydrolase family 2 protein [Bacteroides intestinalis]|uniref:beta-mannosidase n=1 Tax=Bacteroides intestinalis TaxID=329854 RepID=UPI001D062CA1|nr:glycoside hydrolase family 2 protein [Bacteroides intestinalis]MCB6676116.1 glycoside hydrolase family 2 protein [Bacteroides intestinalis]MCB7013201.1 glycoside hydrolase family 2 protein [Bacteroides intestinalis]MCG4700663.1 glycoside hydrolase family 2 protein [Bacteroides intestinalis]MCG4716507.1 glycoside hydrolase family 2 protein [Bacteroides intestinalis]MCG4739810.1 glycoside hydrolase family 2 protein [Bacteroides intestinalis]